MQKNMSDIKKEYGYILRWHHHTMEEGEKPKRDRVYLENVEDGSKIDIVDLSENILNQAAIDFIKNKTYNGFRDKSSVYCYDNYVKLFEIMNIEKRV